MANNEIVFNVEEKIGVLSKSSNGWFKEVNMVSWNNSPAKIDIREWDPDHMHMSKGITLRDEEAKKLQKILKQHFSVTFRQVGQGVETEATEAEAPEQALDVETGEVLE